MGCMMHVKRLCFFKDQTTFQISFVFEFYYTLYVDMIYLLAANSTIRSLLSGTKRQSNEISRQFERKFAVFISQISCGHLKYQIPFSNPQSAIVFINNYERMHAIFISNYLFHAIHKWRWKYHQSISMLKQHKWIDFLHNSVPLKTFWKEKWRAA